MDIGDINSLEGILNIVVNCYLLILEPAFLKCNEWNALQKRTVELEFDIYNTRLGSGSEWLLGCDRFSTLVEKSLSSCLVHKRTSNCVCEAWLKLVIRNGIYQLDDGVLSYDMFFGFSINKGCVDLREEYCLFLILNIRMCSDLDVLILKIFKSYDLCTH